MTILQRNESGFIGVRITFPALIGLVLGALFLPSPWDLIPMLLAGAGLALIILRGNFDVWLSFSSRPDSIHCASLNLTFPSKRTIP